MQMTTIAGIVGILLMLILMFAGVNLAFSFFISGFIGVVMILGFGGGLTYLQTIPVTTAMSYSLAVLPMFMLMGDFAVMGSTDYGRIRCCPQVVWAPARRLGHHKHCGQCDFWSYLWFRASDGNGHESSRMA